MITMAEKMYIKQMYEEGLSKKEISRRTKLNWRTVSKYAEKADWNDTKIPNVDPENYPVLGEYIPIINEWLEGDSKVPRKQRHTAKRIYTRLQEEHGYTGGYGSVKRYVRKKRYVMHYEHTGCLPLEHPMAYAQLDFGEFIYFDATRLTNLYSRFRTRIKPLYRSSRHRIRSACWSVCAASLNTSEAYRPASASIICPQLSLRYSTEANAS